MQDFDARLDAFVKAAAALNHAYCGKNFPNNQLSTFGVERGKRYVRVVRSDFGQRSVHCFVDTTNGDILKAAGWKAPAKGARGNILADDLGMSGMSPYGAAYR